MPEGFGTSLCGSVLGWGTVDPRAGGLLVLQPLGDGADLVEVGHGQDRPVGDHGEVPELILDLPRADHGDVQPDIEVVAELGLEHLDHPADLGGQAAGGTRTPMFSSRFRWS